MKQKNPKYIIALLFSSASLFLIGCGSENATTDAMHEPEHLENHAGDHSNHEGAAPPESPMEASDHAHDGALHDSGTNMQKPEDARLVTVTATDHEFSPADISAMPGEKLFVKLINKGEAVHMWQLRDKPETHVHTAVGDTSAKLVTAPEQPGDYDIICLTPGHEERGMVGTLKVSE